MRSTTALLTGKVRQRRAKKASSWKGFSPMELEQSNTHAQKSYISIVSTLTFSSGFVYISQNGKTPRACH